MSPQIRFRPLGLVSPPLHSLAEAQVVAGPTRGVSDCRQRERAAADSQTHDAAPVGEVL